ncbi:hypothetical protein [Micromonospora sp. NPDC005087]|uniref:hypothetical protein n=1 Tax=Micromonospora sp. NPDC005087 TaxID=3364225 RepID=UPI0036D19678
MVRTRHLLAATALLLLALPGCASDPQPTKPENVAQPQYAPPLGSAAPAPGIWDWITPSMIIALAALAFTIGSFWWMNVRRGRLSTHPPHTFAAAVAPDKVLVNLPLVFHNDGAAPIVVQNLRLRLERPAGQTAKRIGHNAGRRWEGEPEVPEPLPVTMWWRGTRPEVQPREGHRPLPAAFPVPGRTAVATFMEFGREREPEGLPLDWLGGPCTATVEVKMAHRQRWVDLLTCNLQTERVDVGNYIAWPNDPSWQP